MSSPLPLAPTEYKPVSKPTPTLSDLASNLPTPEALSELLPREAYLIEDFLGQGGMGAVYKAIQISLNRHVAIKIMPLALGAEFDFADRFRREAQSMASLSHPGIVGVFDFGIAGNYLYIVMEFIDGSDLHQVLKAQQITPDLALYLMPQICDAVATAHEHGIIHRDIKPANIMLTRDWRVKVADFGLAKRHGSTDTLVTQANLGLGTPDYAAPEQFEPNATVDHRADIYALGVTLYQMLTGKLPRGAWQPPSALVGTDPRLDAVLVKAMSPQPEQRHQTARDLAHAIVNFQQTLAWEHQQRALAATPMQSALLSKPHTTSGGKASGIAWLAGIAAAVALLGIGSWQVMKQKEAPEQKPVASIPTPSAAAPLAEKPKAPSPEKPRVPEPVKPSTSDASAQKMPPPAEVDSQPLVLVKANAGETKAPSNALTLKPAKQPAPSRWQPLWAPSEQKGRVGEFEWKDGRLTGGGAMLRKTAHAANAAIRAIVVVDSLSRAPGIALRAGADDTVMASIEPSLKVIRVSQKEGKPNSPHKPVGDLPVPSMTDGEHRLELVVVGDVAGVSWDGNYLGGIALPHPPHEGSTGVYATVGTFRDIEWQSLDSDVTKPMPQLARLPDPSKWKPVFPAAYLKDGGITFKPVNNLAPADVRFADGAVRVKIPVSELGKGLNMRLRSSGGASVQVEFGTSGGTLRRIWREADQEHSERLVGFGFSTPSETAEFAFVAVDHTLGFFVNNLQVATASLPDAQPGLVSFYGKDASLYDIEWQSLDPAPEAAPKTAAELQLDQLAAEYQAEFDKLGGNAFKTALSTLNSQFAAALDRAAAQAQQKGQLEDVLTLQAEAKRMKEAPSMPEQDDEGTPTVLKPLHDTYRKSLARLMSDRDARGKPAVEAYKKKLTAYQVQLTKAGDLDGAVKAKNALTAMDSVPASTSAPAITSSGSIPASAALPPPRPGRLKGWGEIKSQPIDLTAAAPYVDFIQAVGKEGGWLALRANGELVTSFDPNSYLVKHPVTRLKLHDAHIIAFGRRELTLRMNHLVSVEQVSASNWGGGEVKDAAVSNGGVYIIVRADGTVRLRDLEGVKGKPAIQPNEAAKLTRGVTEVVQSTAGSRGVFALTSAGKVHGWVTPNRADNASDPDGSVQVMDCSALPPGIKQITCLNGGERTTSLYVLTHGGDVRRFDLADKASRLEPKEQSHLPPPGSVAALLDGLRHPLCILKSGERILISSDQEMAAVVKKNSASPHVFPFGFKFTDANLGNVTSRYVLWFE